MDNTMQRVFELIEALNKLPQNEGEEIIQQAAANFSMAELSQVSAFFHEICRANNRHGTLAFLSDFPQENNGPYNIK